MRRVPGSKNLETPVIALTVRALMPQMPELDVSPCDRSSQRCSAQSQSSTETLCEPRDWPTSTNASLEGEVSGLTASQANEEVGLPISYLMPEDTRIEAPSMDARALVSPV